MSSGIGSPSPHSSRIPARVRWTDAGVQVAQVIKQPFHGGRAARRPSARLTRLVCPVAAPDPLACIVILSRSLAVTRHRETCRPPSTVSGGDPGRLALTRPGASHRVGPGEVSSMNTRSSSARLRPLGFVARGPRPLRVWLGRFGIWLTGCKPDYPSCETDSDCKPKEFCVARKCQQCRDTRDCPDGHCLRGRQMLAHLRLLPGQEPVPAPGRSASPTAAGPAPPTANAPPACAATAASACGPSASTTSSARRTRSARTASASRPGATARRAVPLPARERVLRLRSGHPDQRGHRRR